MCNESHFQQFTSYVGVVRLIVKPLNNTKYEMKKETTTNKIIGSFGR
jgi:hypothetical protein